MGSSGVARHLGYGVDPTAAGQVVERVPQTRQQAADPLTPARAGAAVHPGAFRVRVLRADHCPAEHRAELPWDFYFPQVHYAVAWIAIGSIAIHIAVKIPVLWRALRKRDERYREPESAPLSWRGFSRTTWLASGVAVIATAGAIPLLRNVSGLAWRSAYGSQGLPVNRTAIGAGVIPGAQNPNWRGSPVVARLWRSAAARPGQ
jgi:hypothetical protein